MNATVKAVKKANQVAVLEAQQTGETVENSVASYEAAILADYEGADGQLRVAELLQGLSDLLALHESGLTNEQWKPAITEWKANYLERSEWEILLWYVTGKELSAARMAEMAYGGCHEPYNALYRILVPVTPLSTVRGVIADLCRVILEV